MRLHVEKRDVLSWIMSNSTIKEIFVTAIDKEWIKGAKEMVMGYTNKSFVKVMDWMYVRYGHIPPGDLIRNQEEMQGTYTSEDPITTLFD